MNLHRPNANEALQTANRCRNVAPQSGICSRCIDGCRGNCDMFRATFRGREVLYPEPFGNVTAGADRDYPVDYSHLNIMGYAMGAKGVEADPDLATFPNVDTETRFGADPQVKMKIPIFTGALGSTDIARKNWEHFAVGAAISGISIVCGENVCGIDPGLELYAPGKAANAGGVAVSGLEMAQNGMRLNWSEEEVDSRLKMTMKNIHRTCLDAAAQYGSPGNYLAGANIAGFLKVVNAMLDQGLV